MGKGHWQKGTITGAKEILTHDQAIRILSEQARNGSVTPPYRRQRGKVSQIGAAVSHTRTSLTMWTRVGEDVLRLGERSLLQ